MPVATDEIRTSVDTIVDRLEGITSAWDSTDILNVFLRHDGAGCRSIMTELKARGPTREDPMSGAAMVEWLFGDMNVEDARTLRDYLIEHNVVDDVTPTVVAEIVDVLDSVFGSGTRVLELFGLYMRSGGPGADFLLTELQTQTRQTQEQMAVVLFDGLDRVSAWRLARMFYQGGGPLAIDYAARWNAAKIADLLEGWTTRTDSDSIVANFELVPQPLRAYVLTLVDAHTQPDRSAEDALMHDMTQGDYERLIVLGVPLRAYEPQHEGVLGTIGAGAEWVADWAVVLTEWVVCGAIGIFTGLLSAVWDILRSIVDIGLAIRDVLGMIAYFVSGGSIGSGSWLRVKEFFTGIGHAFSNAGQVWDAFWEDQRLQFRTLQGPLADCRRAELLVREVVNGIATIALILFAGYGLVKAGAAAIRALSEFAALVREVGWIEALSRVGAGARELAQLRAGLTIAELGGLVSSLSRPGETLNVLRTTITDLVLAARNEGYWRFLRTRAVAAARRQIAQEGEWWREWGNRRGTWEEGALRYERRRAELEERLRVLREQAAASGRPPEQRDVTTAQDDTDRLQREVDQLNEEMTGERRTEQQPPPQEGQTPPVAAAAAEALTPLQRTIASEVQSILGSSEFAEVRNAQQAGRSVEVAVNGRTIIYQPDMPRP